MQIAIIGGTGRTGVPFVEQALDRGHQLTVLARDRAKADRLLATDHQGLDVVEGDATQADAISRVVAGAEVVVDVTGPGKGAPDDLRVRIMGVLLPAVREAGVARLVVLTGAGVRVDGDEPKVADRLIRGVMRLVQPAVLADGQAAIAAVTASGIDHTVVRAPRLTDAERRGTVRVAGHVGGDTGTTLGRADLASFLLEEAEAPSWSGRAPVVSW
ncbi:MAG: NAD(P)H-binding protein [Nitriliruptoraceae bacterium]|nr:NAD(P)H-binding protein [Nitriliruptoraceae bacterium]